MTRNLLHSTALGMQTFPAGSSLLRGLICCLLLSSMATAAGLPNPRLNFIFPAGARQGTTVTATVHGVDLDESTGLIFSQPGITARPRMAPPRQFETEPQPIPGQFDITVNPDVPPGSYEVRVAGKYGVSTPRIFKVSDLSEAKCDARNTSPATAMKVDLNSIVNCRETSSDAPHYYEFPGTAGQTVSIRCETLSIDSRMFPILEILSPTGRPVAFARGTSTQEAVLTYTPTVDGPCLLKVYDATYRSGVTCHYRLEISNRPQIEFIWPPAGVAGTTSTFTLYGHNLPGGVPAKEFDPRVQLQELNVSITLPQTAQAFCLTGASPNRSLNQVLTKGFEYRLPGAERPSHPVFIAAADASLVLAEPAGQTREHAQKLTPPCVVAGRCTPQPNWFTFHGVKGETYSIDIVSERLNLPTDLSIVISQMTVDGAGGPADNVVSQEDDSGNLFKNPPFTAPAHDPSVLFTPPADGEYLIQVRDLYGSSTVHPRNAYLMTLQKAVGDFHLLVTSQELLEADSNAEAQRGLSPTLRWGGCQLLHVQAFREGGFTGPITLTAIGLPPGVSCPPVVIESGQTQATLVLCAASDAPAWQGTIQVQGTAQIDGKEIQRQAAPASLLWNKNSTDQLPVARVTSDLMLAVIPEVSPVSISVQGEPVREVRKGDKISVTASFTKNLETSGKGKLELRGLPASQYPTQKIPARDLDPEAQEGVIEVSIDPQLPAGDYSCYFVLQTHAMYARNPEAAANAQKKAADFEGLIERLTMESARAEAEKVEAEKQRAELVPIENDPDQESATAAADLRVKEAADVAQKLKSQLAAAQEELAVIKKRAADLAKAAEPKDVNFILAGPPLTIRVLE
ncbi:hypothetical protein SH661x_000646 [Planctomicrobium sp. SH661]|uniref:hypothetical protein n=1 Tax=Planctomicrobium sp. SH661 TaxID=3448124 RepID=UPI003F5C1BFF